MPLAEDKNMIQTVVPHADSGWSRLHWIIVHFIERGACHVAPGRSPRRSGARPDLAALARRARIKSPRDAERRHHRGFCERVRMFKLLPFYLLRGCARFGHVVAACARYGAADEGSELSSQSELRPRARLTRRPERRPLTSAFRGRTFRRRTPLLGGLGASP